ncbi:MAG: hypothetical protein PSV35_03045 [bacterium]|nr:hypothetical protein [bacterium]
MTFSPGDLLLKVDVRQNSGPHNTQHHVMLVLGESIKGYPTIAHMKGDPEWKLVKEDLHRGKDLKLIHYPWSEVTRKIIVELAEQALSSKQFIINREIIESQSDAVAIYRPDCSLDAKSKWLKLVETFKIDSIFNPTPEAKVVMSCHQWVLTIIHSACSISKEPIPLVYQLPPQLAWADRINYSAQQDKSASSMFITLRRLSSELAEVEQTDAVKQQTQKKQVPNDKPPLSFFEGLWGFFKLLDFRKPQPSGEKENAQALSSDRIDDSQQLELDKLFSR